MSAFAFYRPGAPPFHAIRCPNAREALDRWGEPLFGRALWAASANGLGFLSDFACPVCARHLAFAYRAVEDFPRRWFRVECPECRWPMDASVPGRPWAIVRLTCPAPRGWSGAHQVIGEPERVVYERES